jgi:hypothetical protein
MTIPRVALAVDDLGYALVAQSGDLGDGAVAETGLMGGPDGVVARLAGGPVLGDGGEESALGVGHAGSLENLTPGRNSSIKLDMRTETALPLATCYATWSTEQREASDRMERLYNQQRRCGLAQGAAALGHPISTATDDMLRSLAKTYTRQLEDVEDGSLAGGDKRARMLRAKLLDIEREQDFRAALAESWLASEDGTHCYTSFMARGGLGGVLHEGATPPSYELAVFLDRDHWRRGLAHVLDWDSGT